MCCPAGAYIALQNIRQMQQLGSGVEQIHKVSCKPPLQILYHPVVGFTNDPRSAVQSSRDRLFWAPALESPMPRAQVVALMPFLQCDPRSWRQWGLSHLAAWPRLGGTVAAGVALLPAPLLRRFVNFAGVWAYCLFSALPSADVGTAGCWLCILLHSAAGAAALTRAQPSHHLWCHPGAAASAVGSQTHTPLCRRALWPACHKLRVAPAAQAGDWSSTPSTQRSRCCRTRTSPTRCTWQTTSSGTSTCPPTGPSWRRWVCVPCPPSSVGILNPKHSTACALQHREMLTGLARLPSGCCGHARIVGQSSW